MSEQAPASPAGAQPPELLDVPPELVPLELEELEAETPELEEPEPKELEAEEPEVGTPELEEPEPDEPEAEEPEMGTPELEEPESEKPEAGAPELEEPEPEEPEVEMSELEEPDPMLDDDAPPGLSASFVPHPCEVTAKRVHKTVVGRTQCVRARGEPSARVQRAPSCRRRASVVVGLGMLVSTLPHDCKSGH
jgi:hypothetical protein